MAHRARRHGARFPRHAVCQMHQPASSARIIISKSDAYCTRTVAIWHFWEPSQANAAGGNDWGRVPLNCVTAHRRTCASKRPPPQIIHVTGSERERPRTPYLSPAERWLLLEIERSKRWRGDSDRGKEAWEAGRTEGGTSDKTCASTRGL